MDRATLDSSTAVDAENGIGLLEIALPLAEHWKLLLLGPLLVGAIALGISILLPKTYTSRAVFLPPQQQNGTAAALAQLNAFSSLTGVSSGVRSPADLQVGLLQSTTVADRLIDEFKLMDVYGTTFRFQARTALSGNMRVLLGKKDGLIRIEMDDTDPQRAANIANRSIEELRRLNSELTLNEAQRRRMFFETQLGQARDRLTQAQQALQASGFSQGALNADVRNAAESYARLRAEATANEVRLQTLRSTLADGAPEVQQALSALSALRSQIARLETTSNQTGAPDYVTKYREFKYQESLFELFARQYELARADESRESGQIQVIDIAKPAEWKSKPKRGVIAGGAAIVSALLLVAFVLGRQAWRSAKLHPDSAAKIARLRTALRG